MSFINLDLVFNAITSIANPLIKEKILRSETVIKLLQQFNLDPEHPPADFSGVYAYALVEYGVGKPKPLLELFRQEAIKQAFRKALDHNNPSILLSEVDAFLDAYTLGDDIRGLELDVRREVAEFATVFIEVAKRTRTPADVLLNQKIGSLHKRIASIQEQLERLPTLEGIRTEIARLAVENYPALPPSVTENQCRAIALAQQMRGWFETLGYDFEKYEIWAEEYFEWIIHIPVRRSFDRILIRGVAGEIKLSDVIALRQSVEAQKTDEGWLVTTRRISRAARDEVKKEENRHLDCFTFDELIDLDADFNGYLDWLEVEIKRRKIDTKYVPLACTKEEIDPVTKQRIGVSRYEEEDGWIDGYIDLWLDDPSKEHISILGEFGTGKTWFVFHYAWTALQRYRNAQKRGVERSRLPLVITLRDFAKALNVENVLAGFFFTQHNIRINSEVFDQLNRMGKLLLIFDGFDEMAAKVDRQQMINNFWELAKVVVPGAKVILTCRTEHFPEAKEGRALLNAELQASTKKLTGETPQFEVLELEKFNDEQIRQVLSYQAEAATVEQVMGNGQLLDLARRPVMTDLILEALPDIEAGKPVDMSRVYLYAVRRKMERDIKAERTFTSLADKLYFLCELSWEMLSNDQMSLNYRLFPERIRRLFGSSVQEEKDLDHWHYDMMAQTMLVRNADGDYTPAHRSLLEFFVAYKLAAELGALASDFTELAQAQLGLDNSAAPIDYTWSGYFSRYESSEAIAPLREFISESLDNLRETFGQSPLTKAVMDLLVPMVNVEAKEEIIKVIEATRFKSEDKVGYVGGNAATVLVNLNRDFLVEKDLSNTVIKGANLTKAILHRLNFKDAILNQSLFAQTFNQVFSVIFNSDKNSIITGGGKSGDGQIYLWSRTNSQPIFSFKGHNDVVRTLALSPSKNILASGSADFSVKLWDIKTGRCLNTLQGHTAPVRTLAFSPNGQILVSGGEDQAINFWCVDDGKRIRNLQKQGCHIRSLVFSLDGQVLAVSGASYTIKLLDTLTYEYLKCFQGHSNWIKSLAFSPDGHNLVSGSQDYSIKFWKIDTGECLQTFRGHTHQVNAVVFSPDGKLIASASQDTTIRLWDVVTGACLKILRGHDNTVQSLALDSNGETLISGAQDNSIKFWNLHKGEYFQTFQGYANWIKSIAVSPNGHILASVGQDRIVKLWDIHTGKCIQMMYGHTDWIADVACSPNGKTFASASLDCTIRIWHATNNLVLYGHKSAVRRISFSTDGVLLASGGEDFLVKLWKVQTGECTQTLKGHSGTINSITFCNDSKTLISSSADHTVKFWNIETGQCLKTLTNFPDWVKTIAFSPNQQLFCSGSDDYTVRVWDVATGQLVKEFHEHGGQIKALAFSPDGKIIASASDDLIIRLWDIQTEKCLATSPEHMRSITSVRFSPNGQLLTSSSEDGTIKLWNVTTGECLRTLESDRPYEGMNITRIKGLIQAEKATLKALGAVEDGE